VPQRPLSVGHVHDVAAEPDEIWPLLADPSARPAWMTELRQVDAAPGEVAVGDRFVGESSILLHDFVGASEVTAVEPGKVLTEVVVIGARFTSRWELAPSGDGRTTAVRHTIDVEFPAGPFSPLERWVLGRRLLRMQRASLRNLAARF
jgi:uncharacterized protein YndB with AHSA1/START domain